MDDKVHLNRSAEAAMKDWLSAPDEEARNIEDSSAKKKDMRLLTDHATSLDSPRNQSDKNSYKPDQSSNSPKLLQKKQSDKKSESTDSFNKNVKRNTSSTTPKKDNSKKEEGHSSISKPAKKSNRM